MSDQVLFDVVPGGTPGRHAVMLEAALKAAYEAGILTESDEGLVSVARANAAALDNAEKLGPKGAFAVSNLTGGYREVLAELRMTPAAREESLGAEAEAAAAAIAALNAEV